MTKAEIFLFALGLVLVGCIFVYNKNFNNAIEVQFVQFEEKQNSCTTLCQPKISWYIKPPNSKEAQCLCLDPDNSWR